MMSKHTAAKIRQKQECDLTKTIHYLQEQLLNEQVVHQQSTTEIANLRFGMVDMQNRFAGIGKKLTAELAEMTKLKDSLVSETVVLSSNFIAYFPPSRKRFRPTSAAYSPTTHLPDLSI